MHDKALERADKLAELAQDELTAMRAEHVRAAVLDARTRHRDAEPIWQRLVTGTALASAPPEEQIAIRTGHVRNRRALGYFTEATEGAKALLAEMGDRFPEEVVPVRLELAALGVATNDRIGSRAAAQEIIDHYHRRGLPGHINALEAAVLLHEAQHEVFILESLPGEQVWAKAELELRRLVADARRDFGAGNPRTLTAMVAHLRAMVGQGAPGRVFDEYANLPSELAGHLGTGHRLHLRAIFLLGQAHAQNGENQKAFDHYSHALAGQERVLGTGHPETLRTRYELAVQRHWLGDRAGAKREFDAVRRDTAEKIGHRNDLYGQALTAGVLATFLPSGALRAFDWLGRQLDKKRES
jgi:hypothetical protein